MIMGQLTTVARRDIAASGKCSVHLPIKLQGGDMVGASSERGT